MITRFRQKIATINPFVVLIPPMWWLPIVAIDHHQNVITVDCRVVFLETTVIPYEQLVIGLGQLRSQYACEIPEDAAVVFFRYFCC